ncbi:hypothetical protein EV122DRAFT_256412, partial [Schizophyllum commune]
MDGGAQPAACFVFGLARGSTSPPREPVCPLWDDPDFAWLSDVTVYEGASRLAEVGAGVRFWPNTKFSCRKSDQAEDYHFYTIQAKDGTVATCDVLVGADGLKSRVRVGMMERLVSEATRQAAGPAGAEGEVERAVAAGGREDARAGSCEGRPAGTEAEAEALAAAAQPVWSGLVAYRMLISTDKLRERAPEHSLLSNPMLYFGKNAVRIDGDSFPSTTAKGELQCIVGYSIQNGACLNVIFFTFDPAQEHGVHPGEWMRKAAKAEFAGAFEGWEPEVQAMLDCVDGALRWAVHTTKPPGLPTFVHGRTALLGDAAHSMTPFQGSGAGQAVE